MRREILPGRLRVGAHIERTESSCRLKPSNRTGCPLRFNAPIPTSTRPKAEPYLPAIRTRPFHRADSSSAQRYSVRVLRATRGRRLSDDLRFSVRAPSGG
jgi:hypothetical protein